MDTHLKPFPFLHSVAQSRDFFITMSGTEQLRISLQGELMTPPSGRVLLPRRDYKRCSNSHDYVTLRSSAGRSLSPSSVENLRSLLITSLHAGQVTSIKWKEPMRLPSTSFAGGTSAPICEWMMYVLFGARTAITVDSSLTRPLSRWHATLSYPLPLLRVIEAVFTYCTSDAQQK
jgi:hypothetical protein